MKNKLLLAGILVLAMAIIFKTGMVFGEGELTPITQVCKTNGGILMDKDNCPAGADKFPLGGIINVVGGLVSTNGVLFLDTKTDGDGDGIYAVKNDGKVWFMYNAPDNVDRTWDYLEDRDLPQEAVDSGLVFWKRDAFITKDGQVYLWEGGEINGWTKMLPF